MATGETRDRAVLEEGLARWVAAHPDVVDQLVGDAGTAGTGGTGADGAGGAGPAPALVGLAHAEGGMANETILVDLGPAHRGVVVRLPPLEATFPDYELAPQALVQNAVAASGVPAPAPSIMITDPQWIGSDFLVMPRIAGDVPGGAPYFDPYVRDASPAIQRLMHDQLLDTVVAVHDVEWKARGLGAVLPGTSLLHALERWTAYVSWAAEGDPLPALAQSLDWCSRHVPAERDPVLLWGDVRLGNLVFDADRHVTAVLDWDLASIGPREMDLGWHVGLECMMETLFGGRLPGIPGTADVLKRYERSSGYEPRDLAWHEVFALVRALAINDRHQRIMGNARRRQNPMGDILLARVEAAAESVR